MSVRELSSQTRTVATLGVVCAAVGAVLAAALLPAAAECEALALTGSLLVTLVLAAAALMVTHHAPLPLFTLILPNRPRRGSTTCRVRSGGSKRWVMGVMTPQAGFLS
ncbi:hypothetical protein EVAR_28663_1 [Eumeta japonica]|uniref:Uncharacterized protein n=1 Tax=Eumeta variegata TaxID=151549 RepID=A0A4C1V3X8_EUMVA|nr:hypothetical protein EVAR_28663_1 [Eumeta japonica]